jgi:ATP-dependent DNA helicase RecG
MRAADEAIILQKPESEARARLERLVEIGLVEARGERSSRSFNLSGATYRRLGEKAAYIRRRGFEPIQQEQMVLQYAEQHGRITRREAAELCQIEPEQASYLLTRLVRTGRLRLSGQRRGAFYEIP